MILESDKGLFPFGMDYVFGFGTSRGYWPGNFTRCLGEYCRMLKRPFRIVQYYYPIADLMEEVYSRTARVARHTPTKEGGSQFDKATLSSDEKETFDELCVKAANEAATVMMPFMPQTARAYLYDKGYVTSGPVNAGEYAMVNGELYMAWVNSDTSRVATDDFEKLDADVSHSVHFISKKYIDVFDNNPQITDTSIREMIVSYIMAEWFGDTLPERYEQYVAKYHKAREDMRYNLNATERTIRTGHPF